MRGLLADINIAGQVRQMVVAHLQSPRWREIWGSLNLTVFRFADLALTEDATDAAVWQLCQLQELALVTGNRNRDGADSLDATILAHNRAHHLPVFTISNPERMRKNGAYRERVAVRLLEFLLAMDNHLGSGRIFLP